MDIEKYCRTCPPKNHCCMFYDCGFTFLTPIDAKKIKKKTGREYKEFLDYSPLPIKTLSALRKAEDYQEGALRLLQLDCRQRILRLKIKDKRCIFLNKKNRCDIYEIRPNICRIYPFWAMKLMNGKMNVIEHDLRPKCGFVKSLSKYGNLDEVLMKEEIIQIKKLFCRIIREKELYKRQMSVFSKESAIKYL